MPEGAATDREQAYARISTRMVGAVRNHWYEARSVVQYATHCGADVLLICPTSQRSAMSNYVQSGVSSHLPSLRIDLQTFEESQDMAPGTCTLLRHFSSRIKSDFVVLPCDFVPPPSLSLSQLLNRFRTESTYEGAIATACFYEAGKPDKGSVTEDWGMLPVNTPIVFDERTGTLLHVDTPDDVDINNEHFLVRMSLLSQ